MNVSARLNDVTNIAIILAILFIGVRFATSYVQRRGHVNERQVTYGVGDAIKGLSPSVLSATTRTVVLQIRSTCVHCSLVMPLYARLITRIREQSVDVRIVAVTVEPLASCRTYLLANSVIVDGIFNPDPAEPRLAVTPAFLLADSQGKVIGAWVGAPPPEVEREREKEIMRSRSPSA